MTITNDKSNVKDVRIWFGAQNVIIQELNEDEVKELVGRITENGVGDFYNVPKHIASKLGVYPYVIRRSHISRVEVCDNKHAKTVDRLS